MAAASLLRGVHEAVRRVPGSYVSAAIEARELPGMGVGVVAREPVAKDALIFQASQDAWYPFSAEFALREAQHKAPGFVQQLDALFAASPNLRDRASFLPNALVLGTHLAVTARPGVPVEAGTTLEDVYLPSLPEHIDLPFYWDEKQFEALDACHEVRQSIRHSARLYLQIYQHLFGSDNQMISPDAFFWAISILMSRATSGKAQPFTLIPFFDWFNHSERPDECVQEFDAQHGFTIHTTRAYEPGEQLFINYGAHGNTRLLRNYGFTLASNPHDTALLTLPPELQQLEEGDAMAQEKSAILRAVVGDTKLKALAFHADGKLAAESRQWLEMRLAHPEELMSFIEQVAQIDGSGLSTANQRERLRVPHSLTERVRAYVKQLCDARLRQHERTLQQDEQFLNTHSDQMATWLRSALHVRTSEKRILTLARQNESTMAPPHIIQ